MIPNMSLQMSGSAESGDASSKNTTVFGNKTLDPNASYMGGGKPAIAGGGTGININTPINFGESQDNTNQFKKENSNAFSDPLKTNNNIILFGILGVVGFVLAIVLGRSL